MNRLLELCRKKAKSLVAIFMVAVLLTGWLTIGGYNAGADQKPEEGILFMNLKAYAGLILDENESSYMQSLGEADVLTDIERDHGAAAVVSTVLCFILLTPACWHGHFLDFWQYYLINSSSFTRWHDWTMEAGQVFHTTLRPIPAWYLPAWIAVTTPPIFLLAILCGLVSAGAFMIRAMRKKEWPARPVRFRILLGMLILIGYVTFL